MRDESRIDVIVDKLRDIWKDNPDLRLGQIVSICSYGYDIFYIEDGLMFDNLKEFGNSNENK